MTVCTNEINTQTTNSIKICLGRTEFARRHLLRRRQRLCGSVSLQQAVRSKWKTNAPQYLHGNDKENKMLPLILLHFRRFYFLFLRFVSCFSLSLPLFARASISNQNETERKVCVFDLLFSSSSLSVVLVSAATETQLKIIYRPLRSARLSLISVN